MLFTDQLGCIVNITIYPNKIVSVVPSQTELLFNLGLGDEVIGITKFCVHPKQWHQTKTRVGGTKNIDLEKVKSLKPDLIIANKEENIQQQIEELKNTAPVWVSDVNNLASALDMIESVGNITNTAKPAQELIQNIQNAFSQIGGYAELIPCAYIIWNNPFMTVGGDTFISNMLKFAGFKNAFAHQKRYPTITMQDIINSGCKYLLLSSEPYPFKQQHITDLQKQLPHITIKLVDGEMFSWYGSRLLKAANYFKGFKSSAS